PALFGERVRHDRFPLGRAFIDLGRDDALIVDDLSVFAVESDLEPAVRRHYVAPATADAQVEFGDRHFTPVSGPPALDQLGSGPRLIDKVPGRVEVPGNQNLRVCR